MVPMRNSNRFALAAAISLIGLPGYADEILIEDVQADRRGDNWTFAVTLRHADTGWDHYADGWEVRTIAGESLGTRELLHPHETEQPFTRALSGVKISKDIGTVVVRAHCSVDGWVGAPFELTLAQ